MADSVCCRCNGRPRGEPASDGPAGYCFGGLPCMGVLGGRDTRGPSGHVCFGLSRPGREGLSGRRPAGNCCGGLPLTSVHGVCCIDGGCTSTAGVPSPIRCFLDRGEPPDCWPVPPSPSPSSSSTGRFSAVDVDAPARKNPPMRAIPRAKTSGGHCPTWTNCNRALAASFSFAFFGCGRPNAFHG